MTLRLISPRSPRQCVKYATHRFSQRTRWRLPWWRRTAACWIKGRHWGGRGRGRGREREPLTAQSQSFSTQTTSALWERNQSNLSNLIINPVMKHAALCDVTKGPCTSLTLETRQPVGCLFCPLRRSSLRPITQ